MFPKHSMLCPSPDKAAAKALANGLKPKRASAKAKGRKAGKEKEKEATEEDKSWVDAVAVVLWGCLFWIEAEAFRVPNPVCIRFEFRERNQRVTYLWKNVSEFHSIFDLKKKLHPLSLSCLQQAGIFRSREKGLETKALHFSSDSWRPLGNAIVAGDPWR